MMLRRFIRPLFLAWMVGLLLLVWGAQRPLPLSLVQALLRHVWVLVTVGGMLLVGWVAGWGLERWLSWPPLPAGVRFLYRTFVGMAFWSWLALLLAILGWVTRPVLVGLWTMALVGAGWVMRTHSSHFRRDITAVVRSVPWFLLPFLGLILLLALLPPASFDALMYHLALPEWLLQQGRLVPIPIAHFWNPGLVDYLNLWPLALGAESGAKILHAFWTLGALLLVFHWAREVFGPFSARYALLLLLTMPSLPLLASWAYTDYALVFYVLAALYALYRVHRVGKEDGRFAALAGLAAGLALSIKYTAVALPVAGMVSLLLGSRRTRWHRVRVFLIGAFGVAAPWYVRNAVYMGNPVFPFFFGGRFWDEFLVAWYGRGGTGLGLRLEAWLWLPFRTILAYGDLSYVDARIGPWWLILIPWVAFWWPRWGRRGPWAAYRKAAFPFILLASFLWLFGVAWSSLLFQVRLLYPVLFPLAPALGFVVHGLRVWHGRGHVPWRRLVRGLMALSALVVLVEQTLSWVQWDGPGFLVGQVSRQAFYERHLPLYVEYLDLVHQAPMEARILALYEARRYGVRRELLPDTLLVHFPHALYRYGTVEAAVQAWAAQGYTHLLVFRRGAEILFQADPAVYTQEQRQALDALQRLLPLVAESSSGAYALYLLPTGAEP